MEANEQQETVGSSQDTYQTFDGRDEAPTANYAPDVDAGHSEDRYNVGSDLPGTRLRTAFQALAVQGLLAKMRYMCCQSCAGYSLTIDAESLVRAPHEGSDTDGKPVLGCVYYTQQDADELAFGKGVWLAFGQMQSDECGPIGLLTTEVGRVVVEALRAVGIVCQWDGSASSRIWVERASALEPARVEREGEEEGAIDADIAAMQRGGLLRQEGEVPS